MTIDPVKYVRKPLYVQAIQVSEENFAEAAAWAHGKITASDGSSVNTVDPHTQYIHVRVHNPINPKQTKAYIGDWILYTDRGYKIYTDKAFKSVFNQVESKVDKAVALPIEVAHNTVADRETEQLEREGGGTPEPTAGELILDAALASDE